MTVQNKVNIWPAIKGHQVVAYNTHVLRLHFFHDEPPLLPPLDVSLRAVLVAVTTVASPSEGSDNTGGSFLCVVSIDKHDSGVVRRPECRQQWRH